MISRTLSALLLIASSSCATTMPAWNGKIWKARSDLAAVVRTQANEKIACTDPEFSKGYWISREDFSSFVDALVFSCKEWNQDVELISIEGLKKFLEGSAK